MKKKELLLKIQELERRIEALELRTYIIPTYVPQTVDTIPKYSEYIITCDASNHGVFCS